VIQTQITHKQKTLIEENVLAFETSDKNANPNVIAIAEVLVIPDNELIITDNFMVQTKNNIKENPNVCLAVWKGEEGIKLIGKAQYFEQGKWKDFVKNMPENKGLPTKGAILIKI